MIGLAILFFATIYLLLSALVVWGVVRLARRYGIKGWTLGLPAALVMYLIVFWDHIPTLLLHKYYCETEAGFWVYKTPEQWAKENPGVLETLRPWPASMIYGKDKVEFELSSGTVRQYNDRFGFWNKNVKPEVNILKVGRRESGIIEIKTGEFLVYYRDFISGPRSAGAVWKSWIKKDTCNEVNSREDGKIFQKITDELQIAR